MISFAEEIANLYYMKNGCFVIRNYQYLGKTSKDKKQPGNIDIDLIAFKDNEVHIISCKRGSLNTAQEEKELWLFEQGKDIIKKNFSWIKTEPKYVYIAEYLTKSNIDYFNSNNVQWYRLIDIFDKTMKVLSSEIGEKNLVGKETDVLPRILKFLIQNNRIRIE